MKKLMFSAILIVAAIATVTTAQDIKVSRVGVHGAYSMGGDVEKETFGYGIQGELSLCPYGGIELAVSKFSDEYAEEGVSLDMDTTTIGLSLVGRLPLSDKGTVYVLAGVDYNLASMDASLDPSLFSYNGHVAQASVDIDNEFGFHFGGGLEFFLLKNLSLFAEYRYTVLDLTTDITVSLMDISESESSKGSYDFGLAKVGLNYRF